MADLDALHEKSISAAVDVAESAVEFLSAHAELRLKWCETGSAFVLAVDRYMDAETELIERIAHEEDPHG